MYKRITVLFIITIFVLAIPVKGKTDPIISLMGFNDIRVGDTLYDVRFDERSASDITPYMFTDRDSVYEASESLWEAILSTDGTYTEIYGIETTAAVGIVGTPYFDQHIATEHYGYTPFISLYAIHAPPKSTTMLSYWSLHYTDELWSEKSDSTMARWYNPRQVAPVPEPATMLLFGTGLVGLVGARLRKKK